MYKHILIATDGSELADRARTAGLALAKALNARVTVVTVTEPWSEMVMGEPALSFPIADYERPRQRTPRASSRALPALPRTPAWPARRRM